MRSHGDQHPKLEPQRATGVPGFRHLFGPPQSGEAYRGFGLADGNACARTRELLDRLAQRMEEPFGWTAAAGDASSEDENPNIPSGYTYLSQFAAHDLSFIGSPLPGMSGSLSGEENFRAFALRLDTVYGGGPLDKPSSYAVPAPAAKGTPRQLLRLGILPLKGTDEYPVREQDKRALARDLPRVACPHLNDSSVGLSDVLISDPRNDDNPIVAQTQVLFHLLHNAVCESLNARGCCHHVQAGPASNQFSAARRIVTLIYRRIIRHDLMRRLLSRNVYTRYVTLADPFVDRSSDGAMPVEFSHAAFRFGHAMVRASYLFNDLPDSRFGLPDVLRTNSVNRPGRMPLPRSWVIQWSHFYETNGTPANLSRRIGPSIVPSLSDGQPFDRTRGSGDSGLLHRDLLRGASVGLRSVGSLIAKLPEELRRQSRLLDDGDHRRAAIGAWLSQGRVRFSPQDLSVLADDPPLLFFVLFEAAHTEDGLRLGVLGSVIVAEVFFRALA